MVNGTKLKQWLLHRADQQADNVWIFTVGAVLFFLGMGIMLYAEHALAPSIGQEIIVLVGLVLAVLGGLAALVGYLSLSLLRFLRFASRERVKTPTADPVTDPIADDSNDHIEK